MNKKRTLLSIVLSLILMVSPVLPWAEITVFAQNIQTLTIEDKNFYDGLKKCLAPNIINNYGAMVANDDENQTITLDLEKVKYFKIQRADMTVDNSRSVLETLLANCTKLEVIGLERCDLSELDFSLLNNKDTLTSLHLVSCQMKEIPDLTLPNLKTICLSQNDFSAEGACDNLTQNKLPSLVRLWLDDCAISDIDFVKNLGKLEDLSLGDNKLTDDSVTTLIGMSSQNLSELQSLNLGKKVHTGIGEISWVNLDSENNFTDLASLAALPTHFTRLKELDLSSLRITSLQEFVNIRDDVSIDFRKNRIDDFTGLNRNAKFDLASQNISLSGDFVAGRESELPELIKRVLDKNDVLAGTLSYNNCSISEDGTSIFIQPDASSAYVAVESGKLNDSEIRFNFKKVPSYTIPQNLTAAVGDTLAKVVLPAGFTWKDSSLSVGAEGTNTFKAVYTPKDLDRYVVVDDIDVSVIVKAPVTGPTEPTEPTEPSNPTEPTEPTEPSNPTEPTEPTEPTKPTEPSKPTKPTEPSKPTKPTEQEKKEQKKRELQLNAQLKVRQKGKKIEISWGKVSGADGYDVYVQYCFKNFNAKSITPVKSGKTTKVTVKKINGKKINLKKFFKVYVRAYKRASGKKITLAKTIDVHVVGSKNTKYTNVKAVKVKKNAYTLKKGKTATIKASTVLADKGKKQLTDKHTKEFRYATTNKKVATISKKGKIKAVGKGSCTIYVYARNGYAKKVKVKVR